MKHHKHHMTLLTSGGKDNDFLECGVTGMGHLGKTKFCTWKTKWIELEKQSIEMTVHKTGEKTSRRVFMCLWFRAESVHIGIATLLAITGLLMRDHEALSQWWGGGAWYENGMMQGPEKQRCWIKFPELWANLTQSRVSAERLRKNEFKKQATCKHPTLSAEIIGTWDRADTFRNHPRIRWKMQSGSKWKCVRRRSL